MTMPYPNYEKTTEKKIAYINGMDVATVVLDKDMVDELLKNLHPTARKPIKSRVDDLYMRILRGKWDPKCGDEFMIDKNGQLFNGVQRLVAIHLVQKDYPNAKFPVKIQFNVEPNEDQDKGKEKTLYDSVMLMKKEGDPDYSKAFCDVVATLYKNCIAKPVGYIWRKDGTHMPMLPRKESLRAKDFLTVVKCEKNAQYYEYFDQIRFKRGTTASHLYFMTALFIIIASAKWSMDAVNHLVKVLADGSEDPKDRYITKLVSDIEKAEDQFKKTDLTTEDSELDTYGLTRKIVTVLVPWLDMYDGKAKKVVRLSQLKADEFIKTQATAYFRPFLIKQAREIEKTSRILAAM